jgi:hypothetical protein
MVYENRYKNLKLYFTKIDQTLPPLQKINPGCATAAYLLKWTVEIIIANTSKIGIYFDETVILDFMFLKYIIYNIYIYGYNGYIL